MDLSSAAPSDPAALETDVAVIIYDLSKNPAGLVPGWFKAHTANARLPHRRRVSSSMVDDPRRANNLAHDEVIPMSLLKWAIFGLLALPLAELVVFVAVALSIGFLAAVALTILTSLAGAAVIRNAGRGEITRTRAALGDGLITRVEVDGPGFLTVVGGFLLLIPGFITDVLGAALLLEPTRRLLHAALRRAVAAGGRAERPGVVDLAPDQWRHVPDQQLADERAGRRPGTTLP
jgi:UPF0716 protein FxsA